MARIVFDLDGTLVHSAPDIMLGVNTVMAARGLEAFDLDDIISFIGNGLPKLTERVIKARGLDPAEMDTVYPDISAAYDAVNGQETRLYPGARTALDALREAGHRLGLCTNKPIAPTKDVLASVEITGLMQAVVGGDSLPVKKPDPAPLQACFNAMGDGPTIYVGDSEVDAATALAANVPFLLFTKGYRKVAVEDLTWRATFDHFDDLPGLVADTLATA